MPWLRCWGVILSALNAMRIMLPVPMKRIDNTQRVNDDCLEFSSKKRQPRVPFGAVVERGLLKAGDKLYDAGRKHCASIRSDGTLKASFGGGFHAIRSGRPLRMRRRATAGFIGILKTRIRGWSVLTNCAR